MEEGEVPEDAQPKEATEIQPFEITQDDIDTYEQEDHTHMNRFFEQYGMPDEVFEKVQHTLYKHKSVVSAPINIEINKKPMPDYYTMADRQFEKYTRQHGANFLKMTDVSNMSYKETQKILQSKGDLVSDQLEDEFVDLEEDPIIGDEEWHEKAVSLKPGEFQEEINPAYAHLFSKDAPNNILTRDFSKMYLVSSTDYATFFSNGVGDVGEVWDRLIQRGVMIRPAVMPVVKFVADFQKGIHDRLGFIYTGIQGGGKSFLLLQAIHHIYKQENIVVFHIPDLHFWTHGNHYVLPSPILKGYYDTSVPQQSFLLGFRRANHAMLKTMKLSTNYQLPLPSEWDMAKLETIDDLLAWGTRNDQTCCIAFKILLDELHLNKTHKIVFAIDGFNYSLGNTNFWFGDIENYDTKKPKRIHARQMVLIRGIERIMAEPGRNKAFICATTERHPMETKWKLIHFNALTAINVQRYTFSEISNITSYYMSAYYVYGTPGAYLEDLVWVTGGNPGKVWKQVQLF